jgi:hypothetical protein
MLYTVLTGDSIIFFVVPLKKISSCPFLIASLVDSYWYT